jgi:hypothetical protein
MACPPLSDSTKYQSEQLFLSAWAELQNGMELKNETKITVIFQTSSLGVETATRARNFGVMAGTSGNGPHF